MWPVLTAMSIFTSEARHSHFQTRNHFTDNKSIKIKHFFLKPVILIYPGCHASRAASLLGASDNVQLQSLIKLQSERQKKSPQICFSASEVEMSSPPKSNKSNLKTQICIQSHFLILYWSWGTFLKWIRIMILVQDAGELRKLQWRIYKF